MINPRTLAAFGHDLCAAALAWYLAYALRFNFDIPVEFSGAVVTGLMWLLPLFAALFYLFGLYRGLWRFASLTDLQHLLTAVGIGALLTTTVVLLFSIQAIPRSVLLLHPLLLGLMMGGSRFAYRSWKEHRLYGPTMLRGNPVLVLGAGEAADSLLREIYRGGQWYAVAVLSDYQERHGQRLRGIPVYSPTNRVAELAEKFGARHVIMAMPNAKAEQRRHVAELAVTAGLTVLTVPSYDDLLSGRMTVSNIRKVEMEDLLGREEVTLDSAGLHALLNCRVVLISGAGGSIGSELCRQIAKFDPSKLVLLDSSEFALYSIDLELAGKFPKLSRECWAADIRDAERIAEVFLVEKPTVVFHAAAYKHVPMMEGVNAWQAVRTNALGTVTLARAAQQAGVDKFVLISTDKAVNPTNVMGASKRLAERLCRSLQTGGGTRFITVRFGNVLGSNGSVIPKFREQIARGGPVTVTHPDIVRYFMTIPEAAQLVMQAGWMGRGGEIFLLDMGEQVKIVDLARDMIRLSGFSDDEIELKFTGLRPGEKLYEELLADDESTLRTPHPKLRIAKLADNMSGSELEELLEWLSRDVRAANEVKVGLQHYVPEYVYSS